MRADFLMAASIAFSAAVTSSSAIASDHYIKIFGGGTLPRDQDFKLNEISGSQSSGLDFNGGYTLGLALGFSLSPTLSVEGEFVHRSTDADLAVSRADTEGVSASSKAFMVNAIYNVPLANPENSVRPYLGAGIGTGDHSVDWDATEDDLESDFAFAYQLIAGVGYAVDYRATLFGEIRYFSIGDGAVKNDDYDFKSGFDTIDIVIGYSYRF